MNRRQKIIVSVTGIFIVLLILIGLTYAYFLTRINGNTNTKSISVSTANLALVYGDGNGVITGDKIMPGTTVGTKTFSVENTGNTTVNNYSVVLEYAHIEEDGNVVVPSVFERPQDFEIILTCVDKDNNQCNGVETNFDNKAMTLTTSNIEAGNKHNYSLTINYLEPGVDQSKDMNKNLNLKVQIYKLDETADIKGSITGVDETNIVKLESDPKVSTIIKEGNNYYYNFNGIELGTHTLSILNKEGSIVSSETITIKTGEEAGVDNSIKTITINEMNRTIKLETTLSGNTVTSEGTILFNPYESDKTSLAYNIINNAINVTTVEKEAEYAEFRTTPITTPAVDTTNLFNKVENTSETSISIDTTYQRYYWTYGTGYTLNEKTGKFTLTGVSTCKYNDGSCNETLVGKYIRSSSASDNSSSTNTAKTTTNLSSIYKVTDAPAIITMKAKLIYAKAYSAESTLSMTTDDYGTSYYYRGGVKNNYLTFNNMCWRIVRIEGDGAIKIILESTKKCSEMIEHDILSAYVTPVNYGYTQGKITNSNGEESTSDMYVADYVNGQTNNTNSMKYKSEAWLTSNGIDTSKLKEDNWCLGNTTDPYDDSGTLLTSTVNDLMYNGTSFYYDTYVRLYGKGQTANATLKCSGNNYKTHKSYIGTLTADEVVYAGGKLYTTNTNYYLSTDNDYGINWLTLSSGSFEYGSDWVFSTDASGTLGQINVFDTSSMYYLRPALTLASGTVITGGNGTQTNPYIVG